MTTLLRTRRRAEDFAARVDGSAPVRAVGTGTAPADVEVERLVGLTQTMRAHSRDAGPVPREEFVTDLRERLMAEAATVLTPRTAALTLPHRTRSPRERRLVAVAAAAVVLGGSASMAAAAQSALPGEALYPIKRGIEQAEAVVSISPAGRGRDLLHQASDRLDEVQGLIGSDAGSSAPQIPGTLDAFSQQAQEGADLLMSSYSETRDPDSIAAVREFTQQGLDALERLSDGAPPEALPGLRDAALSLQDIDAEAARLCDTCSDLPALSMPPTFLVSAEVDRALGNLGRLRAGRLDNSHPVIVDKQTVRRVDGQDPAPSPDGSSGSTDAGSAPQAPQAPKAGTPSLPQPTGVPKVELRVEGGDQGSTLGDGLGGLAETLLPDPQQSDLLP